MTTHPSPASRFSFDTTDALRGPDAARVAAAVEAELAASTRTTYAAAWRQWERWCTARHVPALPAVPELLAVYLTERAESGVCFGTLDGACAAIAHRHGQEGLLDPTASPVVRRVRWGLRRIMGTAPQRQAHPLSVAEVVQMVTAIDVSTPIGSRDRAVILLGYASALRVSELSALDLADVTWQPAGLLLHVRRSKTDQDGHGQVVGVARGEQHVTDPVRALEAWLESRVEGTAALFTFVRTHGRVTSDRLGPRGVSRLISARAAQTGLEGLRVTGHSLRAGHATTAALNGVPIARIAAQTRHRDLSTLYNHYIRPVDALRSSSSRDLGL